MSESGHSQPGMYGQGRRRRRRRGDRDAAGPPGQNLSGPSRDREYQPRERRVTKIPTLLCVVVTAGETFALTVHFICLLRMGARIHQVHLYRRPPSSWRSPPGRGYVSFSQTFKSFGKSLYWTQTIIQNTWSYVFSLTIVYSGENNYWDLNSFTAKPWHSFRLEGYTIYDNSHKQ